MNSWLAQNPVECLGWTLVHFVWQGLMIAALLAGWLRWFGDAAPNRRYLAGCAAMLLLAAAPVITFSWLSAQQTPVFSTPPGIDGLALNKLIADPGQSKATLFLTAKPAIRALNFSQRLEKSLSWVVLGWSMGVLALSCRLLAGWLQIKRIKRRAVAALDEAWRRKLAELGRRLGMKRPVGLWQSALVEVPTVIGWLRPVILLPAGCLVGLSAAQLEAIIAHELAHIRRHDYLVNLLQNVVETLLFYHPAVWWVSRRIREEREHCCDDLAVEICGDRVIYARALATLEELRHTPGQLALAAAGAPLLQRIRRLAGKSGARTSRPGWPLAGMIALLIVVALAAGLHGNRVQAAGEETAATNSAPNHALTNQAATATSADTNLLNRWVVTDPPVQNLMEQRVLAQPKVFGTNQAHAGPGVVSIHSKLNQITVDSMKYDHLPLSEVIKNLAEIAKQCDPEHVGINFYIERQMPSAFPGVTGGIDPANGLPLPAGDNDATAVNVSVPTLNHLRLIDLLDAITRGADRPLRYSVLDYAVAFSLRDATVAPLETRTFHVDPNTFRQGLEGVVGIPFGNVSPGGNGGGGGSSDASGGQTVTRPGVNVSSGVSGVTSGSANQTDSSGVRYVTSTNQTEGTQTMLRQFFTASGVDLDTNNPANAGKTFMFNDRKGILMVRATTNDLDKIGAALQSLNQPPPQVDIKVKLVEMDMSPAMPAGATNAPYMNGILTAAQFKTALAALEKRNDANEWNGPEVTTENGRQVQMQVGDAAAYAAFKKAFESGGGGSFRPEMIGKWGPVLDIIPHVSKDKTAIELSLIPTTMEFVGFYDPGSKPAVGDFPDYDPAKFGPTGPQHIASTPSVLPLPHFRLQTTTNDITILDGETVVLGRPNPTSAANTNRYLMMFVTPTLVRPDGQLFHADETKIKSP